MLSGRRKTIKEKFFPVRGNIGKAVAASGAFYQAGLGEGLRLESPEQKETGRLPVLEEEVERRRNMVGNMVV